MRPKDPYLRTAACAFWAGDSKSDMAAWSLPGPVQTVYRAELFAILVALEVFRGDVEVVSDCKGVVDEAERIRAGGTASTQTYGFDARTPCLRRDSAGSLSVGSRPMRRRLGPHIPRGPER